ncbi:GntR family transcriptional regulator [Paracoccus caeni]|uniref:GntR family transcriptional regulator n=1 Tax=Paracoccus caeni TaxID=657651 RepID=UPI00190D0844|nr:FCD domain-containing protein [Paracoccus caeni]
MTKRIDGDNKTLMTSVYDRLRLDIVDGELRPGGKLRFEELKERYGIGLSPLREALTRLASEKLVVLEEHKGFHVAPISRADLLDLLFMRQEVEVLGIRRSIEAGDDAWEAGIVGAIHALGKRDSLTSDGHIDPEWERRHHAFHDSLVAASGSPRLMFLRAQLTDHADRYRRLSHHYQRSGRDHLAEHTAIADAVIARDPIAAERLIRAHLARTVEIILDSDDLQIIAQDK